MHSYQFQINFLEWKLKKKVEYMFLQKIPEIYRLKNRFDSFQWHEPNALLRKYVLIGSLIYTQKVTPEFQVPTIRVDTSLIYKAFYIFTYIDNIN